MRVIYLCLWCSIGTVFGGLPFCKRLQSMIPCTLDVVVCGFELTFIHLWQESKFHNCNYHVCQRNIHHWG